MKMLIVDDDRHLRKLVYTYAGAEGFDCVQTGSGAEAITLVRNNKFDIIILDIMMPGLDGFETLAEMRKYSSAPVIMLTARSEEYDKLRGFELGADDYVVKPFSPQELMARVNAILRRTKGELAPELRFGGLYISEAARSVYIDGKSVDLPPKQFDLLLTLAKSKGAVLNREHLIELVWGYDFIGYSRTVDTHIKELRDNLGKYRDMIQTVWGVGYKFEYKE